MNSKQGNGQHSNDAPETSIASSSQGNNRNVRKKHRSSKNRHDSRQRSSALPQNQQEQGSRQQSLFPPTATHASHRGPSLLVARRGSRLSQRQKKIKKQRKQRQRTVSNNGQNRVAKVQEKINEEISKAELDGISLIKKYTCRNILYFVIIYSVVLCLRSAVETYTEGMVHQVEQKYYYPHTSLGILSGVKLIGFLSSLIFVAFFARNSHKPLLICIGVMICCLGAIVWPVPYFIDGSYSESLSECGNLPTVGFFYSETCQYRSSPRASDIILTNSDVCSSCVLKKKESWWHMREVRFSVMCVGGLLIGVGTGLFATLGIVYIEESGETDKSPVYYGILMSMMGLGKFLGSCLAWWFYGYSENLEVSRKLQAWEIRAWWLGMVVLSVTFFLAAWVFLVFPKWLVEPAWVYEQRHRRLRRLNFFLTYFKNKEKERQQRTMSELAKVSGRNSSTANKSSKNTQRTQPERASNRGVTSGGLAPNSGQHAMTDEEFLKVNKANHVMISNVEVEDPRDRNILREGRPKPKVSKKLGKHFSKLRDLFIVPGYTLVLLGVCLAAYFPAGFQTIMSTFVHHQFQFPTFHSWFYTTGLSYSLAWCIGPVVGGIVIYRFQLVLRKQLSILILLLLLHISIFFFMLPISCQPTTKDFANATVRHCLDTCGCNYVQREPICSVDGVMYTSTCQASCFINSTCSCTSTALSGENCISNCPIYALYWIFLFISTILFSMGSVSVIIFFLRLADEDYKTLSISVAFWIVVLAAYVPGSAAFDGIAWSSCSDYRQNCLSERICFGYYVEKFRFVIHGSNIVFQGGAFLVLLLVNILVTTKSINFGPTSKYLRDSFRESNDLMERELRRKKKSDVTTARTRSTQMEGENQEDRLRKHLQFVEQLEKRSSSVEVLEKSTNNPDVILSQTNQEVQGRGSGSSNLLADNTPSNDSSTQKLLESSHRQQQSVTAELPSDPPLTNREMVENYLSSIPDEFVYSRQVSVESQVIALPRNSHLSRGGVDNPAFDPRESAIISCTNTPPNTPDDVITLNI